MEKYGMYRALTFNIEGKNYHINISVTATAITTYLVDDSGKTIKKKTIQVVANFI